MVWEYRVFMRTAHGGSTTAALRALLGLGAPLAPAGSSAGAAGAAPAPAPEERTDFYVAGTGEKLGL